MAFWSHNEIAGFAETRRNYYLHYPTKMMTITLTFYIFLLSCLLAASLVETLQVPVRQGGVSFPGAVSTQCRRSRHGRELFLSSPRERDQRRTTRMMLLLFRPFHLLKVGAIQNLNLCHYTSITTSVSP